jgi:hypothetical protein
MPITILSAKHDHTWPTGLHEDAPERAWDWNIVNKLRRLKAVPTHTEALNVQMLNYAQITEPHAAFNFVLTPRTASDSVQVGIILIIY